MFTLFTNLLNLFYIDSLIEARSKARRAEFTSDLSDDNKQKRKFKKIKPPYSPSSSISSEKSIEDCPVYNSGLFYNYFSR